MNVLTLFVLVTSHLVSSNNQIIPAQLHIPDRTEVPTAVHFPDKNQKNENHSPHQIFNHNLVKQKIEKNAQKKDKTQDKTQEEIKKETKEETKNSFEKELDKINLGNTNSNNLKLKSNAQSNSKENKIPNKENLNDNSSLKIVQSIKCEPLVRGQKLVGILDEKSALFKSDSSATEKYLNLHLEQPICIRILNKSYPDIIDLQLFIQPSDKIRDYALLKHKVEVHGIAWNRLPGNNHTPVMITVDWMLLTP